MRKQRHGDTPEARPRRQSGLLFGVLLDAERLLWIEARGARGGHPDGHECDERQQDRDDDESGRIPGFYAEEEAGEEAREPEGGAESDGYADESESHAMAHDEIANAGAVGAESHAN